MSRHLQTATSLMGSVDTTSDPMQRLDRLKGVAWQVDAAIREQVSELRVEGASWARIGEVLGLTRQGAQQRYGGGDRG